MRKVFILPVLLLPLACADSALVEPSLEPGVALWDVADRAARTDHTFQASRDWLCGAAEGCLPGTMRTTPSGVAFFEDFKALFVVTGDLAGDLWIMGDVRIDLRSGKGTAVATALLDLTEPGVGTFECQVHADYEDYNPPLYAYVEHARYSSCKGAGDFEGMKMKAWLTNEANPGLAIAAGLAEIR